MDDETQRKLGIEDATKTQMAENHRFFGDMRFKQLTLLMGAMSAAAAGVMQYVAIRWWIALGAMCVTAVMWVIVARLAIPEVFPPTDVFWKWINSSFTVLLLHVGFYALWLNRIRVWGPTACFSFFVGAAVGIALAVFSIVNYWRHREFWFP
jgi:hypothetical protein